MFHLFTFTMLDLINLRNREFVERYNRLRDLALERRQPLKHSELVCDAILKGAPRYYTTFDYAYRMICLLRKGLIPPDYNPLRLAQWREIASKIDHIKDSLRIATDYKALSIVLSRSTASRFFISQPYAERLLHRLRRENRRRHIKPLI